MWNLFKKNKQKVTENNLPSGFGGKRQSNGIEEGFYSNGKFSMKVSCNPEYCIGTDSFGGGCHAVYVITEDDITSGSCAYRSNAIFMWKCKYCNTYHALRPWTIPESIKDKVFYRDNSQQKSKIVSLESYKRAKGKN